MDNYYFHMDNLSVGYGKKALIHDICIGIKKGEIVTLIGPNGSGKSTILKSITRQLQIIGGKVYFDDRNLNSFSYKELSTRMAVVLTERMRPELMTCHDIVATGRYPYTGRLGILSREDEEKGYNEGPMGFDVPSNMMIIIYGLLFGEGSYEKAMCTAVNYGEDTDCTAGTIAALYGMMYGRDVFEEKWTKPIGNKLVTISIDPFLMYGKIPKTVEELTERVTVLYEKAQKEFGLTGWSGKVEDFYAKPYFRNIYREMNVVRFEFSGLNIRLDYCGDPVIRRGEPKKIKFILSNKSKYVTSDRVNVYLYGREGCEILPQKEQNIFLSMAHMGDGIRELDYEILVEEPLRASYRFVAEFVFEENKNNCPMEVPFVLLSEAGQTVPVVWEKKGPACTPNLPRV